jgi:hypothetical protein
MIHVRQVAQLVHYYIVLQMGRQLGDAVIKPQVAQCRASAPPRARVADKYFAVNKMIVPVKMV